MQSLPLSSSSGTSEFPPKLHTALKIWGFEALLVAAWSVILVSGKVRPGWFFRKFIIILVIIWILAEVIQGFKSAVDQNWRFLQLFILLKELMISARVCIFRQGIVGMMLSFWVSGIVILHLPTISLSGFLLLEKKLSSSAQNSLVHEKFVEQEGILSNKS